MLIAQSGGGILRQAVEEASEMRRFPLRRRSSGSHQPLPRGAQQKAKALHLDPQIHKIIAAVKRGNQTLNSSTSELISTLGKTSLHVYGVLRVRSFGVSFFILAVFFNHQESAFLIDRRIITQ
jgi:hypothetical protein